MKMDDGIKIKIITKPSSPIRAEAPRPPAIPPRERDHYPVERKKPPRRRYGLWIVALISVIFLFFAFSYMFSSADISITPKAQDVSLNATLSAAKDPTSPLPFDLIVISGEETRKVKTDKKDEMGTPARGTVILYNAFSPNSQILTIDTRLEGSNGKIYKTEKRIVIPGQGRDKEPGKVEVGIYGAETGEEYNSEPLDFKIFGFKGTPKYEKFYGRSKTSLTGGVKGEFYVIGGEEKDKILSDLKKTLKDKLTEKAVGQIPGGFVLFKDAVFLTTPEDPRTFVSKESFVPVIQKGTLYGFLFDQKKLTKKIAEDTLEKYDGSDVYIYNLKNISFTLANKENMQFSEVKNLSFSITGNTKIVWKFDSDKFASELLGKEKKDFNGVLSKYPNVVSANLILKPFWRMSFPDKMKSFKMTINYPK